MTHDYPSTLPLSQRTWLEYSFGHPDMNSNNNNFSSASRSRSGLGQSFSSNTLSKNSTSPTHLSFSRQQSREQRSANREDSLYSQPVENTNSLSSPITTNELGAIPLVPNDSPTTEREPSAANSSPTALMADPPSSPLATGTRSRPISVTNSSFSNSVGSSSQSRYASSVRSLFPSYFPQTSANRICKSKLDQHLMCPPTPGSSSEISRASVVRADAQDKDRLRGGGGGRPSANTCDGRVGGSAGREQSHSLSSSSLPAGTLPDVSCLMDKISSMATVVAKLQQAFDNHILSLKYGDTNPVVDEACKNAIMQMQQKSKEMVDSLAGQTEKVVLQRLDESLRNSTDTLIKQLRTSTDAVQDLIQQAQPSQSTFMQDLAANLLRTFEDCLQRFEEQIGPRIIEKARERAIALVEEKGQELVMSLVAQTEKVVQQRLEESLQTCTETMAGHMRTAVDVIQDQFRQSPSKQGHTSSHYEEAWKSQYDSRISTEISELKLAIVALNASTQQNQKLFQEQLRLAKRLSHQGLSERKGSSSDRLTPMDHQSSLSPISMPREAQAHPPEAEATRHDDEQGVTVLAIQPPNVLAPIVPLSESSSITILPEANNCATEHKAAVEGTVMGKRAQAQIRGPCSSTNAAGSGRQNPTSVGKSSTRGLSAVAIGKQVARQDVFPYVAINPAGVVRRTQVQVQTSTTDSSSILASNVSTAFSAHLQRESNFPQEDFDGNGAAYVVIHGMSGPSSIPKCAKRGRGRPRKNNYNANIGLPSDDPATYNKRMKADLATMGSRTGKVAVKAEDIIELTPRVTRSSGKMNHPGIVYWDLETAAQRIQEAGIRFSF